MTTLFKRAAVVTLIKASVTALSAFGTGPSTQTTTVIRDLRMKFQVEKNLGKEPNTCTLAIHNLSKTSRAQAIQKPLHVRIDAGYEDEGPNRIFSGDLIWGDSTNPRHTWITKMQVGDGSRVYKHARSNRSFKAGTSIKEVLGDVAKTMGLEIPKNVEEAKEFAKQFVTGVTIEGPSRREMDRLVKGAGHGWSQQNGVLQILKKGARNTAEAITISQDAGMLGVPEFGPPDKPKDKPVLKVRTLLDGRLSPGGAIVMQAKIIKGLFVIQKVVHEGDTHGKEWYSTIEAIAL